MEKHETVKTLWKTLDEFGGEAIVWCDSEDRYLAFRDNSTALDGIAARLAVKDVVRRCLLALAHEVNNLHDEDERFFDDTLESVVDQFLGEK